MKFYNLATQETCRGRVIIHLADLLLIVVAVLIVVGLEYLD
jgi:hypothetical protein